MSGIVRLGAIGVVIGLMFMVTAPTDARAMTPISLFNIDEQFPVNVTGDAALPESGIVIAYNESSSPRFSAFTYENGNFSIEEFTSGPSAPTFGLIVAFSQNLGLQLFPFGLDGPGAGGPLDGTDGSTGSSGDGAVTHAPEPATWIMMILGFWIVAWRLRRPTKAGGSEIAAPA